MQINKPLPHDDDAEQEILTAILVNNEIYYDFMDILMPDDFYRTAHQLIYSAIQNLFSCGKPVDTITLNNELKTNGTLNDIGGTAYILKLAQRTPLAINGWAFAEIIKNKAILRRLIKLGNDLQRQSVVLSANPSEIISSLELNIKNIGYGGSKRYSSMPDVVDRTTKQIEQIATASYQEPIYTGLTDVDRLTAGFKGGKLIFIAARPGIGKTSLMLTMVRNMAKAKVKVGVMSIEMEEFEIDTCWLAMESKINSMRLQSPKELYQDDWKKIVDANESRSQWPVIVDDSGGATIASVQRTARKMVADGCKIIFIDQLSKIAGTRIKSKFDEVTEVVEALGTLKKELRIPIVVLAQINRQGGDAPSPRLSHLKNTGQIEEEADMVLILHREEALNPLPENRGLANIEIAKQRSGPVGNVTVGWNAKLTQFYNLERRYVGE